MGSGAIYRRRIGKTPRILPVSSVKRNLSGSRLGWRLVTSCARLFAPAITSASLVKTDISLSTVIPPLSHSIPNIAVAYFEGEAPDLRELRGKIGGPRLFGGRADTLYRDLQDAHVEAALTVNGRPSRFAVIKGRTWLAYEPANPPSFRAVGNADDRGNGRGQGSAPRFCDDAHQPPCAVALLHAGPSQRPFFAKGMPRRSTESVQNCTDSLASASVPAAGVILSSQG
jgi:hypothetical protein